MSVFGIVLYFILVESRLDTESLVDDARNSDITTVQVARITSMLIDMEFDYLRGCDVIAISVPLRAQATTLLTDNIIGQTSIGSGS